MENQENEDGKLAALLQEVQQEEDEIVNFLIDEMDLYQTPWDDAVAKACEKFDIPNSEAVVAMYERYIGA
jgi:predicted Mrr-cat superfamily restriction endonuclease